jgi:nitroreductase
VDPETSAVGPDAPVLEILRTTRAMRRLKPDPVPDELLRSIVEAATWAPSAGNLQLAQYLVVTDRTTMSALAVAWRRVIDDYRAMMSAAGVDFGSGEPLMRASIDYQSEHFAETPALIVVCEDMAATSRTSRGSAGTFVEMVRRHGLRRAVRLALAWSHAADRSYGASFYPAVQNLLLAARAHGLGAGLTSWHLFAEDEFKRILGLPKDVRTWALIPIGWPLGRFGPVKRRPVDEVIHREHW